MQNTHVKPVETGTHSVNWNVISTLLIKSYISVYKPNQIKQNTVLNKNHKVSWRRYPY